MRILRIFILLLDFVTATRPKNLQYYNELAFDQPLHFMQRSHRADGKIYFC